MLRSSESECRRRWLLDNRRPKGGCLGQQTCLHTNLSIQRRRSFPLMSLSEVGSDGFVVGIFGLLHKCVQRIVSCVCHCQMHLRTSPPSSSVETDRQTALSTNPASVNRSMAISMCPSDAYCRARKNSDALSSFSRAIFKDVSRSPCDKSEKRVCISGRFAT